jgi:hypothetical protein
MDSFLLSHGLLTQTFMKTLGWNLLDINSSSADAAKRVRINEGLTLEAVERRQELRTQEAQVKDLKKENAQLWEQIQASPRLCPGPRNVTNPRRHMEPVTAARTAPAELSAVPAKTFGGSEAERGDEGPGSESNTSEGPSSSQKDCDGLRQKKRPAEDGDVTGTGPSQKKQKN